MELERYLDHVLIKEIEFLIGQSKTDNFKNLTLWVPLTNDIRITT